MKEINLIARLCAYTKVDNIKNEPSDFKEMTKCDVDKLFDDVCSEEGIFSKPNEVTISDIDALFSR